MNRDRAAGRAEVAAYFARLWAETDAAIARDGAAYHAAGRSPGVIMPATAPIPPDDGSVPWDSSP